MSQIKEIKHKDKTLAIVVGGNPKEEGVNFVSPAGFPLQLGFHKQKKNFTIRPHIHENPVNLNNATLQEVFVIRKGKVKFNLYQEDKKVNSVILSKGDTILLSEGGHGVEFLEDTDMVEIRQGPYNKETNKRFLE